MPFFYQTNSQPSELAQRKQGDYRPNVRNVCQKSSKLVGVAKLNSLELQSPPHQRYREELDNCGDIHTSGTDV